MENKDHKFDLLQQISELQEVFLKKEIKIIFNQLLKKKNK